MQRKMNEKRTKPDNQELLGNFRGIPYVYWNTRGEERETGTEEMTEEIMTGNVPRFGTNNESQNPESSENVNKHQ